MDLYFSDIFNVSPETIAEYGAFNVSLVNDLPLFIDPFLLFNSSSDAYQQLHAGILQYVRFLRDRAAAGSIRPGLLKNWFVFKEVKQTWLGYSLVGNRGSGLGLDFARALYGNLQTICSNFGDEDITRSSHLEKLCLIKSGVGRDNISDFTTCLIKEYLLTYTQDFARRHLQPKQSQKFAVPRVRFNYGTGSWETAAFELPAFGGDFVILTPKGILTKDDTWINKTDMIRDFSEVADSMPNEQLRAQLEAYLVSMLPDKPKPRDRVEAILKTIGKFPAFVDYYIRYKEETGDTAVSVSELRVREVENVFHDNVVEFRERLRSSTEFYATGDGTYAEARARVMFLKDVIENKGGQRLFYDADGRAIRRESDLQILFRLCWFASPADVSREVNDGRGPVDFKVSMGGLDKSLIELKLASNSQLRRNLERQVNIYQKASDAPRAMKVITYFSDRELNTVRGILADLGLADSPDVILIDARADNKPSGSRA